MDFAVSSEGLLKGEKAFIKAIGKFSELRTELIIKNYNILEYLRTLGSSFPP